jgi:hypothetical protein
MDSLDFVLIMTPIILLAGLGFRHLSLKEYAVRVKAQKDAQISAQNRKAAQMKGMPKNMQEEVLAGDQLGQWVPALLEGFGIDPEVLFEDEMPGELKALLPLAKGYFQAQGGLPGIAAALQKQPEQSEHQKGII